MLADGLSNPPLNTVAHHGLSDRARKGETDTWPAAFRLAKTKSRKERTRNPGTFVINSPEILRSQQTDTFGKAV